MWQSTRILYRHSPQTPNQKLKGWQREEHSQIVFLKTILIRKHTCPLIYLTLRSFSLQASHECSQQCCIFHSPATRKTSSLKWSGIIMVVFFCCHLQQVSQMCLSSTALLFTSSDVLFEFYKFSSHSHISSVFLHLSLIQCPLNNSFEFQRFWPYADICHSSAAK